MSDQIISRDEAIDRMKAGLPCETETGAGWIATDWTDFNEPFAKFRRPPEPRRVARSWWVCLRPNGTWAGWSKRRPTKHEEDEELVHVREVLPGDVVLSRTDVICAARLIENNLMHSYNPERTELLERMRAAAGLIGEGS